MKKQKLKWFSVLLLYPDYIAETFGHETFYAFVQASDNLAAIAAAQRQAGIHNRKVYGVKCGGDFHPLLVLKGRHRGEPTEA